jgi:hypothetical protein
MRDLIYPTPGFALGELGELLRTYQAYGVHPDIIADVQRWQVGLQMICRLVDLFLLYKRALREVPLTALGLLVSRGLA